MRRRDGAGAEAAVCAGFCALFQKTGGGFGAGAREERFSGRRAGRVARISPRADGPEGAWQAQGAGEENAFACTGAAAFCQTRRRDPNMIF